jgi:uncharacterized protein (TIGR02466 family)
MIENIFPLKIYKVSLGNDTLLTTVDCLLEEFYEKTVCNNQGSMRNNGLCSYNAARHLHTISAFDHITSIINHHVNIYWKELGYDHSPYIHEMWTNKYPPGAFIDAHNHAPMPATVTLYLKKEADSGNIVFEHPLEVLLKHQPFKNLQDRNLYHTLFDHELEVTTGDLVIFPGWLKHKTHINHSASDRIIIGANIHFRP